MLSIEELPSIKGIAEVIISEGRAGQLILFSIPSGEVWSKWREYFLQALRNRLSERGEEPFWDVMIAGNEISCPQHEIASFLGIHPTTTIQRDILSATGSEAPLIIELYCEGRISDSWQQFIENTARFFRIYDSRNSKRVICIFLIAPGAIPSVRADPGLRSYAFWNPLRWEEARLIAADSVSEKENVLARAWLISTYAGAANSDPDMLTILSRNTPRSLADVRRQILAYRTKGSIIGKENDKGKRFFEERRWDVPIGLVEKWQTGALLGSTLDRGAIVPWGYITEEYLTPMLNRTIWREQVAGIYPLLMEITLFTAEAITQIKGKKWKSFLPCDGNEEAATEPGQILSVFKENQLGFLPEKINELLQQLRFVRNRLAHLEPVDFKDVHRIWSLFDQIQHRHR